MDQYDSYPQQDIPYQMEEPGQQSLMEKYEDKNLIELLDSGDIIEEICLNLRGFEWSHTAGKYRQSSKEFMNEEGIKHVKSILRTYLQKGIVLSNLNEKDICLIIRSVRHEVIGLIRLKTDQYGIHKSDKDSILNMITNSVYSNLKRALNGFTAKFVSTTHRRTESVVDNQSQEKKKPSVFNMLGTRR